MKQITEMTKKEFQEIRRKEWNENVGKFDALVIIPANGKELHDSGFRFMTYVLCKDNYPVCLSSGCSDVLHINGIGGYGGYLQLVRETPVSPIGWSIDCLPKSGYLRLFCDLELTNETDLSSFDVIAHQKTGDE